MDSGRHLAAGAGRQTPHRADRKRESRHRAPGRLSQTAGSAGDGSLRPGPGAHERLQQQARRQRCQMRGLARADPGPQRARGRHRHAEFPAPGDGDRSYFFRRATTLTLRVCEIAPRVSASETSSDCSCWSRFPAPLGGLADSGRPPWRICRRLLPLRQDDLRAKRAEWLVAHQPGVSAGLRFPPARTGSFQ
jgi:hypothetical protein